MKDFPALVAVSVYVIDDVLTDMVQGLLALIGILCVSHLTEHKINPYAIRRQRRDSEATVMKQ